MLPSAVSGICISCSWDCIFKALSRQVSDFLIWFILNEISWSFLPLIAATQIIQGKDQHGDDLRFTLSEFVLLKFLAAQESDKGAEYVQADLVPPEVHLMHAHLIEYLDDLSYIDHILRVISSHRVLFPLYYYLRL